VSRVQERSRRSRAAEEVEREIEEERRLRRARITAVTGQTSGPESGQTSDQTSGPESGQTSDQTSGPGPEGDEDEAPARRMEQQALWVDMQVRRAMERGDFDELPGAGKPIRGLGSTHDPDWWVKSLIEREQITGVLPPALALRKEDAELDDVLDRETTETGVRQVIGDFNRRIVEARRQLTGGPPVITPIRDEDAEVAAWRARREQRRERQRRRLQSTPTASVVPLRRRRWWRRNR
jgi:hypothetical protein